MLVKKKNTVFLMNLAAAKVAIRKRRHKVKKRPNSRKGCPTRPRRRKSVLEVFQELGRKSFRRAYRMHLETFFKLYTIIKPHLLKAIDSNHEDKPTKHIPNGRIHPTVRLACTLRMFAGGEPHDIVTTYGVSKTEVHESLDYVIYAINSCDQLKIKFPTDHASQLDIAEGFKKRSKANIDCCCGAIDGMLVWIEKPSEKECARVGVGSAKFYCGRKKKFGLNLQAVCDHKRRFLNISIMFPGSTSDFLAFQASPLRMALEEDGYLAPGLCLFGDNAYVNRKYMATPYTNVGITNPRDSYNFYHSQLRINIECAFGMLVNKWSSLRKALPWQYSMEKKTGMVNSLCRLHNFCIDAKNEPTQQISQTANDSLNMEIGGAITLSQTNIDGQDELIPDQLLHGGAHFDDDPGQSMRRAAATRQGELPRDIMFQNILENDLRRPSRRSY